MIPLIFLAIYTIAVLFLLGAFSRELGEVAIFFALFWQVDRLRALTTVDDALPEMTGGR